MSKRDYYEVLEVARDADAAAIKKAYRKQAIKFHPDKNPGDAAAEESFKEAAEAYEVLSDPEKRQLYDQFGHEGLSGQNFGGFQGFDDVFSNFGDIFGDIFGFGGGGGRRRRRRGADLRHPLEIDFNDAVFGTERELELPALQDCGTCEGSGAKKGSSPEVCSQCGGHGQVIQNQGFFTLQSTCPSCRGTGRLIRELCDICGGGGQERVIRNLTVKIPAGVANGTRIRLSGEGESGGAGAVPGDLYVEIHVRPHERFERHEYDIHCAEEISFVDAALGAKIEVETIHGTETVSVKAGTQPNTRVRLRGRGVPHLRQTGEGDHVVHLKVVIPEKLSRAQKKLLEEFRKSES